ncbi:DUF4157 domain-containing protein [Myxococcus sp. RHSTA-1-4]|uniref:DUF4157 domain-containing protein n=1 Tax=Myxococcus sp. RHSTA-1-4 TaxID=2874601 RepID=UPI001CBC78BB|nr:DUF4157 domain-containing protein [Myxococcus sp. RHSTA-1-4]MBZ4422371.1 DUF4157 domain-containing protein [Myxococcus sp. RHSTA-1-4]
MRALAPAQAAPAATQDTRSAMPANASARGPAPELPAPGASLSWDFGRIPVHAPPPGTPPPDPRRGAAPETRAITPTPAWDFRRIPVHAPPPPLPRAVAPPGHPAEARADAEAGWMRDRQRGPGAPLPERSALAAAAVAPARPGTLIHEGAVVDQIGAALGARGFSFGGHVFLTGEARASADLPRILGHELAHARHDDPGLLHADGQVPTIDEFIAHPPPSRMFANIGELVFYPVDSAEFVYPADPRVLYAIAAFRLTGERYDPDMVRALQAAASAAGGTVTGLPPQRSERARVDTRMASVYIATLRTWLREHGRDEALDISAEQERLIVAGRAFPPPEPIQQAAARAIVRRRLDIPFDLLQGSLVGIVPQYGRELWPYVDAVVAWEGHQDTAHANTAAERLVDLLAAFAPITRLLDQVRQDAALQGHAAYELLFPPNDDDTRRVDARRVVAFHTYVPTQPRGLLDRARAGSEGRSELLDGFLSYLGRVPAGQRGNTVVTETPSRVNAPPLPSRMTVYPALEPPHFDAALNAVHHFTMAIQWPDVYEALGNAFGGWTYEWDLIKVRESDIANLPEAAEAEGRAPSFWDPLATELARDVRYAGEDMARVRRDLGALELRLGPPGMGAETLVAASAMVSTIGTVVRNVISEVTMPRNEERFALTEGGLHIVRCRASPRFDEDREESSFRRATSVAWLPFWARTAQSMAELRTAAETRSLTEGEARLAELESLLSNPDESLPNRAELITERDALRRSLHGSIEAILQARLRDLRAQKARIDARTPAPGEEGLTSEGVAQQLTSVERMLAMRSARTTVTSNRPVRLVGTLVTDVGDPIHLLLEAARLDDRRDPRRAHWTVSDLTTERSGFEDAWSDGSHVRDNPNHDAILNAILEILEGQSGYGVGYLSVFLPSDTSGAVATPSSGGVARTVRVARSLATIAVNAVENVTQLITIAAIVAAPFTGGASLVLLVPVGIVGAMPSAYRLYHRHEMGTLRVDAQTAMEIVDIVGAVVGLSELGAGMRVASQAGRGVTRSALRWARVQGALWIVGLGSDGLGMVMMGTGLLDQLAALEGLPAGMRAARAAEILGNALLQVGIQAGGALASRRHAESLQGTLGEGAAGARPRIEDRPRGVTTGIDADIPRPLQAYVRESADLPTGEVRVVYESRDGLVDAGSVHVLVGPGAAHNIAAHLPLVNALRGYSGVAGRIRRVINRLRRWLTGRSAPEPGSQLFEARLELEKLDRLVSQRLEALARTRDPGAVEDLVADLGHLDAQVARHEATIREGIDAEGRGYVAVEGGAVRDANRTAALAAGYPEPPAGHFYRRRTSGEGFDLVADPLYTRGSDWVQYTVVREGGHPVLVRAGSASDINSALAQRAGYDPPPPGHQYLREGTGWQLQLIPGATEQSMRVVHGPDGRPLRRDGRMVVEPRPRRGTFETRQASAGITHPTGDYAPLETALTGRGVRDDATSRGILRQWTPALEVLDGIAEANPGQNLRTGAETAARATAHLSQGYGEAAYGQFRRTLRSDELDVITGNGTATPAVQRDRLDLVLAQQPDNASAGALFTGWVNRRLRGGEGTLSMTSLRDRELALGHWNGADRFADTAVRLSETQGGQTVTREFLGENKLGGSYDPAQSLGYHQNLTANGGEVVAVNGARYAGVVYICESQRNASRIVANLDAEGRHPNIRVVYVDADGNLQPVPRAAAAARPAAAPPATPSTGGTEEH